MGKFRIIKNINFFRKDEYSYMALEVGQIVEGTVTGLVKFGVFVELEGKKVGLVHISEVANEYVSDVNDYLKLHDKVKVKVLSVDEKGKVALSIKQAEAPKVSSHDRFDKGHHRDGVHREGDRRESFHKPERSYSSFGDGGYKGNKKEAPLSFEDKLSRFLKVSDERQLDLRRNVESKRGGRGSKRND